MPPIRPSFSRGDLVITAPRRGQRARSPSGPFSRRRACLPRAPHLQLVVSDVDAARAWPDERGVKVSDVQTLDPRDGGKFVFFNDPDGNNWAVQEMRNRRA
jgi:catechol 2,3-dioxygenase-like lactoylglutathione lyase family enzyme